MIVTAHTVALCGLKSLPVKIVATLTTGLAGLTFTGHSEAAMRETKVRVVSALARLGVYLEQQVHVLIAAPPGSSSHYDLAVACAVLAALGKLPPERLADTLLIGELGLDGKLRASRGVLPMILGRKLQHAIVPAANAREASFANLPYYAEDLGDVTEHLKGINVLPSAIAEDLPKPIAVREAPAHIAAQADEIIATGKRRILLLGPPGSGKTILARAIRDRMPALDQAQALENARVYSAAGILERDLATWRAPPFRAPHHSVSEAGLLGGGDIPRPGEVSLAHNGVLFLDELPEFRKYALEALAAVLGHGSVGIARKGELYTMPARPAYVIGSMNPCPCGYHGGTLPCRCTPESIERYRARLAPIAATFEITVPISRIQVAS